MDVSNLVRDEEITSIPVKPDNDDEYTIQLVRKKKLQRSGYSIMISLYLVNFRN